jgi:GntR family transcriptional repressor for pyruvate dehydrogenase complex
MPNPFTPVPSRGSLSKAVESQIEAAIRSRTYVPGAKLPSELELCQQFQVSRTAIREALRMLSARGLVSVEKGKGIFVRNVSAETVTDPISLYLQLQYARDSSLDVIHARQIIEPPIAASAALYHTKEDADRLVKDFEDLVKDQSDYAELSRLDMKFHLDIAKASENTLIPLILEPIHRLMPQIKSSVYENVKDAKEMAVKWHKKILDAILRRDAEGARVAMAKHLEIAEQHVEQTLKRTERSGSSKKTVSVKL